MGRFVPPHDRLLLEELGQDRFRLLAPLWFEAEALGGRIVKAASGFLFDRESIPRWLPWIYAWLAGTASRAGAIHDWLTQVQKVEDLQVDRRTANAVYYEATKADGNGWLTQWIKWLGVSLGGRVSWRTGPARFQRLRNDRRQPDSLPKRGGARREDQLVDLVHKEWRRRHPEAP
ncbi:MAG: DUF1353 domain-containing protein [Betaproteobacteria bacterium]|nr:DUF1353 domain-containing protein [Betaproteobacteria bacterium]